jgi:hypothetical protein
MRRGKNPNGIDAPVVCRRRGFAWKDDADEKKPARLHSAAQVEVLFPVQFIFQ